MTRPSHLPRVLVAVLTYQRPDELSANLPAVLAQAQVSDHPVEVCVVDNDPAASARSAVAALAAPHLRYVVEPQAGIAAARNRALHEASAADLLVFIDDDERPRDGWLDALLRVWHDTGAAAVPGRVVPSYLGQPDPWLLAGGFFDRPVRVTGSTMPTAAAGNLLLDLHQVRRAGLLFEEPFGLTGGEDTLFGRRLVASGGEIRWCDEAVVEDRVPVERLTRSWVLQRKRSHGNVASLVDLHLATSTAARRRVRARRLAAGAVLIGQGWARSGVGRVSGSAHHHARGLAVLHRGLGMIDGAVGRPYEQYARES
ncbi:glycosyltransferase family 2 protein [Luteipulveratus halotolerans]|uniref:Glycosyltransferase 2-like domain-containing protein n=1 Tax=Luteipulveratus halotolerans TaxID=1631356 RepID=A0A0L6CK72_9MICO|nr:glycosyltransferase family A protein [Luteipulveratus halotolerans]KNX38005.1 hypothetical protein VV01_13955 [Luteipulveratus halotolerans]